MAFEKEIERERQKRKREKSEWSWEVLESEPIRKSREESVPWDSPEP